MTDATRRLVLVISKNCVYASHIWRLSSEGFQIVIEVHLLSQLKNLSFQQAGIERYDFRLLAEDRADDQSKQLKFEFYI